MPFHKNPEHISLLAASATPTNEKKTRGTLSSDETKIKYGSQENEVHRTSDVDALLHVLKSGLGTGVLATANGFKNAGLIVGAVGIVACGILCTHCTYIMVKCADELALIMNKQFLCYSETVEYAMLNCKKKKIGHYATFIKNSVDVILFCTYYGVNTIYIIFIAATVKRLVEQWFDVVHHTRVYILAVAIPVFIIGMIRSMKYLVPFSAVANILLLIGLCLTFYYVLQDLPSVTSRPFIAEITHWPVFISTVFFGMEGIGTIFPIKNSMKNPEHFLYCPWVLVTSMSLTVLLFLFVGFFGYLKYGELTQECITLNLPENITGDAVKGLVGLAILFSYGLQLTVCMEIIWKKLEHHFDKNVNLKSYYLIRFLLIFGTVLIAIMVPNLGPVISLIGSLGFSMCGLFYPALVQILMRYNDSLGKWKYIFWKNLLIILLSIFAAILGGIKAVTDIIKD